MNEWQFGKVLRTEYVKVSGSCYIRRLIVDVDPHTMQMIPRFWYQWITDDEYKHHKIDSGRLTGESGDPIVLKPTSRRVER